MVRKNQCNRAELIKEGKNKEERFEMLSDIAKYQLGILNNADKINSHQTKELENS